MSPEERNAIVAAFYYPNSGLEVLLTNFRAAGAGLNLQFVCHYGQIWAQPWNGNVQGQGMGTLSGRHSTTMTEPCLTCIGALANDS